MLLTNLSIVCSATYTISSKGKNLIKKFETCQLKVYRVPGENFNTVGWGHKITEDDPAWLRRLNVGSKISQAQADKLFAQDVADKLADVNWMLRKLPYKYSHSQGFIDGLTSLVYNCGVGGVMKTSFWKRLNNCRVRNGKMDKNDYAFTISAVKNANVIMRGHIKRRIEEYKIMMS